jgi:hypothetical protein
VRLVELVNPVRVGDLLGTVLNTIDEGVDVIFVPDDAVDMETVVQDSRVDGVSCAMVPMLTVGLFVMDRTDHGIVTQLAAVTSITAAYHFQDVDLAAFGPADRAKVMTECPEGRPDSLPIGNFGAYFDFPVLEFPFSFRFILVEVYCAPR